MLFEGIVDSILRRHAVARPAIEEKGRVILERLHELLDDSQQGCTSSSKNPEDHVEGKGVKTSTIPS